MESSPAKGHLLDAIEKIQKRAARWICCRWSKQTYSWSESYEEAHTHLHWHSLATKRTLLACCPVYKIINNMDCIDFSSYFSRNPCSITRSHNLSLFCVPARTNTFRYSFFINSPHVWNSLPPHVVRAQSFPSFKFKLYSLFSI